MKTILKSTEIETKSERQMESVNRAELFRQIGRQIWRRGDKVGKDAQMRYRLTDLQRDGQREACQEAYVEKEKLT